MYSAIQSTHPIAAQSILYRNLSERMYVVKFSVIWSRIPVKSWSKRLIDFPINANLFRKDLRPRRITPLEQLEGILENRILENLATWFSLRCSRNAREIIWAGRIEKTWRALYKLYKIGFHEDGDVFSWRAALLQEIFMTGTESEMQAQVVHSWYRRSVVRRSSSIESIQCSQNASILSCCIQYRAERHLSRCHHDTVYRCSTNHSSQHSDGRPVKE